MSRLPIETNEHRERARDLMGRMRVVIAVHLFTEPPRRPLPGEPLPPAQRVEFFDGVKRIEFDGYHYAEIHATLIRGTGDARQCTAHAAMVKLTEAGDDVLDIAVLFLLLKLVEPPIGRG